MALFLYLDCVSWMLDNDSFEFIGVELLDTHSNWFPLPYIWFQGKHTEELKHTKSSKQVSVMAEQPSPPCVACDSF